MPSLYSSIAHCKMFVLMHQNGVLVQIYVTGQQSRAHSLPLPFFLPAVEIAKIGPKTFLLQNRKIGSCSELITDLLHVEKQNTHTHTQNLSGANTRYAVLF